MKRLLLIATSVCSMLLAWAGGEDGPIGARSMAMGNSSVVLSDVWSAFNNQAGLLSLEGLHAGVYYENLFFIEGLGEQGLVLAQSFGDKAVALNMSSFGISGFRDDRYGLAYSMRLGEKLDMGVQLNYHQTRIAFEEYGNRSSVTAELGLISRITDEFTLAFHLSNPWQESLNEFEDERIPTVFDLGGAYIISEKVLITAEVSKDIERPAMVRSGLEYNVMDQVYLRAGISTEPVLSGFGAGVRLGALDIDIAASYHRQLGFTSQIALHYALNKGE